MKSLDMLSYRLYLFIVLTVPCQKDGYYYYYYSYFFSYYYYYYLHC